MLTGLYHSNYQLDVLVLDCVGSTSVAQQLIPGGPLANTHSRRHMQKAPHLASGENVGTGAAIPSNVIAVCETSHRLVAGCQKHHTNR